VSDTTAWVKKPHHTKGLDPLGVQAPSINLYGQLLPGITNVTDRARYYSFYPWTIWTYNQLPGPKSRETLVEWVRRADCLFTMIGIRHRIKCNDNDPLKHDAGLIGSQTLRPIVEKLGPSDKLRISTYTLLEEGNPHRYFKNPLGGLRQYYIGTFDSLGLMKSEGSGVAYTTERGAPMAEALDQSVDRPLFRKTIEADEVTAERLDALGAFCPCRLTSSAKEHESLANLFFDRTSVYGEEGKQRRRTLGLLLDLTRSLPAGPSGQGVLLDHHVFRGCVYSGYLPDGKVWDLPQCSARVRSAWAVYQRNELLSLAAQCVFWVALQCLEDEKPELATTTDFLQWFADSTFAADVKSTLDCPEYEQALKKTMSRLPGIGDWRSDGHEIALARRALELYAESKKRDVKRDLLTVSARILLNLIARDDRTRPAYSPMSFPPEYFSLYPVNLESLRRLAETDWLGMSITNWLAWLAGHWGIEAHLGVALRKLRHQNQDTFHVLPTERGLVVAAIPDPTYTTPRFAQAVQILQDIGAIDRFSTGNTLQITTLGEDLLRISHD